MKRPLEPDKYYHIYNHANGKENLFVNEGNYCFFLQRYANFINPIADTDTYAYAYCLMPNHFHLAIRIKSEEEILKLTKNLEVIKYISKQFSNLFSSYTQAFNKQQDRMGSLFIPRFSRKHIDDENYFRQLILYIHLNPLHHGFVRDFSVWKHSSFKIFLSEKATSIKRKKVLEWFENRDNFFACHQQEVDKKMILDLENR